MKRYLLFLFFLLPSINALIAQDSQPKNNNKSKEEINKQNPEKEEPIISQSIETVGGMENFFHDLSDTYIATGIRQSKAKAPAIISILTADEIEKMGAQDIDDILESIPGVHVSYTPRNFNPVWTFRGIYSVFNPEVLLLINSVRTNITTTGNRGLAWGGMPIKDIQRIEVIRGPGSAVYGADAFAGVINIVTKQAKDLPTLEAGIGAGDWNTTKAWVFHGGTHNDFEWSITGQFLKTDGDRINIEADGQTDFDAMHGTNISKAPGHVSNQRENYDLRADLKWNDIQLRMGYQGRLDTGPFLGGTQTITDSDGFIDERLNADLTYNTTLIDDFEIQAQVSFLHNNFEIDGNQQLYPDGYAGVFDDGLILNHSQKENTYRFDFSTIYYGFRSNLLRIGAGYHLADLYETTTHANFGIVPNSEPEVELAPDSPIVDLTDTSSETLPEIDRYNYYIYLQDTWTINNQLELTLGLRFDEFEGFDSMISPRAALVWSPEKEINLKLLYGRAFRSPPAFYELYLNAGRKQFTGGNPDLDLETIDTLEFAINYKPSKNLSANINFYYYERQDYLLEFNQEIQNTGDIEGKGLEAEIRWSPIHYFQFLVNYALHKSSLKDSNQDTGAAPRNQIYSRLSWNILEELSITGQWNFVSGIKKVEPTETNTIENLQTVDLSLLLDDFKNHWDLKISCKNIFDRTNHSALNYAPIGGYNIAHPGRNFLVEVSYSF